MDSEKKSPEYMLLFKGANWMDERSPEEIQDTMVKWMDWFNGLMEDGRAKAGQPLARQGRLVTGKPDGVVADGPFVESKEAVGGYFLLQVDTIEEAVEIAQKCPALKYGMEVEVRPVTACCAAAERLQEMTGAAAL